MQTIARLARLISMITLSTALAFSTHTSNKTEVFRPVTILVITAVDYEFNSVSALLDHLHSITLSGRQIAIGSFHGMRIAVIRSGWGKAQASAATALGIKEFRPKIVMMAGVGGGIDPSIITSGDVVVVQGAFQYDLGRLSQSHLEIWSPETPQEQPHPSANFESSPSLVEAALVGNMDTVFKPWALPVNCACEKNGTLKPGCTTLPSRVDRVRPRVCTGVVASGDAFLVDPSVSEDLVSTRHAVAVDMETAAVAEEAANNKLRFIGIRVVADVVNGSNEDLYYCLKPFSGPRLQEVVGQTLIRLNSSNFTATANLISQPCQINPESTLRMELRTLRHAVRVR